LREIDGVQQEGYCLLRLCEELESFVRAGRSRKTYLRETERFLEYLNASLSAIKRFARQVIVERTPLDLQKVRLKDFGEIETALDRLYAITKQAIDADSLAIPFSLVTYLNDQIHKFECADSSSLVVLCGSDLMYYKWNLKPFRDLTVRLGTRIQNYPPFPNDTGILEFPYFAANDVLLNCIFFHETGHYLYEKANLHDALQSRIVNDFFEFASKEKLLDVLRDPLIDWRNLLNYVRTLILRWTDELFADIFAIRTLGAAFHLACRELEHVLPSVTRQSRHFSDTHPADDFRFKVHAKWLREGEWLKVLEQRVPTVYNKLVACEKLKVEGTDFEIHCRPPIDDERGALTCRIHGWMQTEFDRLIPLIEDKSSELLQALEKPIVDFNRHDRSVTALLEHGVVPSTLFDSEGNAIHPLPTTILNSGYFFYLSGMDALLRRIKSGDHRIDKRVTLIRRLNEWLGKALDDWQFIQKRARQ